MVSRNEWRDEQVANSTTILSDSAVMDMGHCHMCRQADGTAQEAALVDTVVSG